MNSYYSEKLSAQRLMRCYDIAPPRVRRYLKAEVDYVLEKIHPSDTVLELGCGYGRILPDLAQKAQWVFGIDISYSSLLLGQNILRDTPNCTLLQMDALYLAFPDKVFDCTVCIQNGISAFHVDQKNLIRESIRVTRPGGTVLFSTYSEKFWEDRLEWFLLQSKEGLVGEIDEEKTGNGLIVCKDGFTATTVRPHEFRSLTAGFHVEAHIVEVNGSSIFCEIVPL